jgi:hypothetical protein
MRVCRSTQPLQGRSRIRLPSGVSADCRNVRARGWHRLATEGCGARHPAEAEVQGRERVATVRLSLDGSGPRSSGRGLQHRHSRSPRPHSHPFDRRSGGLKEQPIGSVMTKGSGTTAAVPAPRGRAFAERRGAGWLSNSKASELAGTAACRRHPNACSGEKRSSRSGRCEPQEASRALGLGPRRRGFKAIHGPAVAEWGTLSVEEAPRRSCHLLRCRGAVVRRSARRLDILKGLAGPVEHR